MQSRSEMFAHRHAAAAAPLTDGQWHRLHPLTPLLRGGIALVVILGFIVNDFRDTLLNEILPGGEGPDPGDPVQYVVGHGALWWVLLGVLAFILILLGLFTLSWRMHEFRITGDVVEVRSGVIFRNHRKARLDRIQGVNVGRPFLPRLFGTARLEIVQAGDDATVQLAYLGSGVADDLRRRILALAAGAREDPVVLGRPRRGAVREGLEGLLEPELDVAATQATRVVRVHTGRLVASMVLSGSTVSVVVALVAIIVSVALTGRYVLVVALVPGIIAAGGQLGRRLIRSLRYTIAATPDGVRIGYGVVSLSNETLPPGRVHAIGVRQPLLWRPFGWWSVRIDRAAHVGGRHASDQEVSSLVLPVGNAADVRAVLEIVLPGVVSPAVVGQAAPSGALSEEAAAVVDVVGASLLTSGDDGGFQRSPRRGAWLRPLSWRRNGYRLVPGAVVLRLGAIWRSLVLVPLPRVQSVKVSQGPVERRLGLASVAVHTVPGPVAARIGALAAGDAYGLWEATTREAIVAARSDRTHRWRADAVAAARGPLEGWSQVPHPRAVSADH